MNRDGCADFKIDDGKKIYYKNHININVRIIATKPKNINSKIIC